jgi:hypothetical protein
MKIKRSRVEETIGAEGIDDPNGITGTVCREVYSTDKKGLSVKVAIQVDYAEADGRPKDLCNRAAELIRGVERGNQLSLIDNPAITKGMRKMVEPIDGEGITGMTISSPDGDSVTITAEDAKRIRERVDPKTGEVRDGRRKKNGWGKAAQV